MSQLEPEQPLFDDDESQLEPLQSVLLDLSAEVVFEPQSLPLHEFEELVLYDDDEVDVEVESHLPLLQSELEVVMQPEEPQSDDEDLDEES